MSDREEHFQAAGFASIEVEVFQNLLHAASEKLDEAIGAIANAVGQTTEESGNNALAWANEIKDVMLPEMLLKCEAIKAELLRYSGGF